MNAAETLPARSYARANQELAASFRRYLEARGMSPSTIRSYHAETVTRLVEFLGSVSAGEADRRVLRDFLGSFHARGAGAHTLHRHAAGLRAFFKFLVLAGLAKDNPALLLSHRKMPRRLPRVLAIAEVDALIAAARSPIERAVPEVLYATGVRVAELVNIRTENIDFGERVILIKKGKGGKDRYVLFGRPAAKAMWDYLDSRPSRTGFLFEAGSRTGVVYLQSYHWYARFYADGVQHTIGIGSLRDLRTEEEARKEFERIAAAIPGYRPRPPGPYTKRSINWILSKLARRAELDRVHPHSLRRAMACHMLSSGANIRVIQELLGHERVGTTQLYTHLTVEELKAIHQKAHPHERRGLGVVDAKER